MAGRAAPKVATAIADSPAKSRGRPCCSHYHEAVELIGKRWTGAIVAVLMEARGPLRFSEITAAVPDLSDRLLSERMKELETRGLVARREYAAPPARVEYELTEAGRDLEDALCELGRWARRWLA